jgi:hypothetical protein
MFTRPSEEPDTSAMVAEIVEAKPEPEPLSMEEAMPETMKALAESAAELIAPVAVSSAPVATVSTPAVSSAPIAIAESVEGNIYIAEAAEGDIYEVEEIIEDNNLSPRSYIIQISSSENLRSLERTISKLGVTDDVSYFSRQLKGKMWHSALFGNYDDYASAKKAVPALQARTGLKDLWVRRYGAIK